jgi:hypothetical protein
VVCEGCGKSCPTTKRHHTTRGVAYQRGLFFEFLAGDFTHAHLRDLRTKNTTKSKTNTRRQSTSSQLSVHPKAHPMSDQTTSVAPVWEEVCRLMLAPEDGEPESAGQQSWLAVPESRVTALRALVRARLSSAAAPPQATTEQSTTPAPPATTTSPPSIASSSCGASACTSALLSDPEERRIWLQTLSLLVPLASRLARPALSEFHVGVVGLSASGRVYLGANLEFPPAPLNTAVHAEQVCILEEAKERKSSSSEFERVQERIGSCIPHGDHC